MTEDVRRLLGGYATGTLTEAERRELFEAALGDPALFAALADEQALKELLEDSAARSQLLEAASTPQFTMGGVFRDWFDRPKAKFLVALGGVALIAIAVTTITERHQPAPGRSDAVSTVRLPQRPTDGAASGEAPAVATRPVPVRPQRQTAVMQQPGPEPAVPATPAAPDSLSRVGSPGGTELTYTVLRRDADGQYVPVPPEYGFSPEDRATLRVESNARGMLLVRSGEQRTLFAGTVTPESPVLVPQEVTFGDTEPRHIRISFTPMAATVSMKYSADDTAPQLNSFRQPSSAAPAGARPKAALETEAAEAALKRPPEATPVTVELTLRRKDP